MEVVGAKILYLRCVYDLIGLNNNHSKMHSDYASPNPNQRGRSETRIPDSRPKVEGETLLQYLPNMGSKHFIVNPPLH